MMPLCWLGAALAGEIYVNGTRADIMPAITMENVTVRFDIQGNCWIEAPMYKISVVPGASSPSAYTPAPAAAPAYAAPAPAGSAYVPPTVYGAPTYSAAPLVPAASPGSASYTASSGVGSGTWWLVTEDNDSAGQAIDVKVNGNVVRRVRSGEGQVIIDIGTFLSRGANRVELTALPGTYGGGLLAVYLGKGTDAGGTVRMDTPEVRFARRATDNATGTTREFTLNVP